MNLSKASCFLHNFIFRAARAAACVLPGGRMVAFGTRDDQIGAILVVNLTRQPRRWRRVIRELRRFRMADGSPLTSIVNRFAAIDARDGRAIAATADVDPNYRIGDQLYVQPDKRLAECFSANEPVMMTRQETAVARSHIEVWKSIAKGPHKFVLVLEDDIWFRRGAAAAVDSGWQAALQRCRIEGGPRLLYLSYSDAGGTAERADVCDALFRPVRGLWFLSGYVLSKEGAVALLKAMPVIGPVDMWINYRFDELQALALSTPSILQRHDSGSDNSYSVLPFLARAGIVDAGSGDMPSNRIRVEPLLAWTKLGERDGLAMALSMLGLRVRVFDGHENQIDAAELSSLFDEFDALVDPPLSRRALSAALANADLKFVFEPDAPKRVGINLDDIPAPRTAVLSLDCTTIERWEPLCTFLGLAEPVEAFPLGASRSLRVFRDDRPYVERKSGPAPKKSINLIDDSPWVLPPHPDWPLRPQGARRHESSGSRIIHADMSSASPELPSVVETFPGNLATFAHETITYQDSGANISISVAEAGLPPYRSGAFASRRSFEQGRFEAGIRAARGSGLVTGFFLHRSDPRQEIDVELAGGDPRRMLVNVYFNPGDDGSNMSFGYRGTPCHIDLGFDSTLDIHMYAIDWQPGRIVWSVDGKVVHERVGWDPTPIPHLPMRLHANLWAPRSEKLAGQVDKATLPSTAAFRNISVFGTMDDRQRSPYMAPQLVDLNEP
ncbi:glycoside hydrolase [Mesorhizobium sp. LNJC384A00]|nr:glycoside hydrolase [Mesorhizobium sp. LNJC384A00]